MNRLVGKVAVITGAGSGIGRASAKLFVAEGPIKSCAAVSSSDPIPDFGDVERVVRR